MKTEDFKLYSKFSEKTKAILRSKRASVVGSGFNIPVDVLKVVYVSEPDHVFTDEFLFTVVDKNGHRFDVVESELSEVVS